VYLLIYIEFTLLRQEGRPGLLHHQLLVLRVQDQRRVLRVVRLLAVVQRLLSRLQYPQV
jgi:hypothetical protein